MISATNSVTPIFLTFLIRVTHNFTVVKVEEKNTVRGFAHKRRLAMQSCFPTQKVVKTAERKNKKKEGCKILGKCRPGITLLHEVGWIQYFIVIVFEKSRFSPSTRKEEKGVFKNCHSGERFKKVAFSAIVYTGCVWTEGHIRKEKVPFSNGPLISQQTPRVDNNTRRHFPCFKDPRKPLQLL